MCLPLSKRNICTNFFVSIIRPLFRGRKGESRELEAGKLDLANLSDSVYFTWEHFKTDYISEGDFKFWTTTKLCSTWHLVRGKSTDSEFTNAKCLIKPKYQLSLLGLAIHPLPEDFMKSLKISDDGVVFFGAPQFE